MYGPLTYIIFDDYVLYDETLLKQKTYMILVPFKKFSKSVEDSETLFFIKQLFI